MTPLASSQDLFEIMCKQATMAYSIPTEEDRRAEVSPTSKVSRKPSNTLDLSGVNNLALYCNMLSMVTHVLLECGVKFPDDETQFKKNLSKCTEKIFDTLSFGCDVDFEEPQYDRTSEKGSGSGSSLDEFNSNTLPKKHRGCIDSISSQKVSHQGKNPTANAIKTVQQQQQHTLEKKKRLGTVTTLNVTHDGLSKKMNVNTGHWNKSCTLFLRLPFTKNLELAHGTSLKTIDNLMDTPNNLVKPCHLGYAVTPEIDHNGNVTMRWNYAIKVIKQPKQVRKNQQLHHTRILKPAHVISLGLGYKIPIDDNKHRRHADSKYSSEHKIYVDLSQKIQFRFLYRNLKSENICQEIVDVPKFPNNAIPPNYRKKFIYATTPIPPIFLNLFKNGTKSQKDNLTITRFFENQHDEPPVILQKSKQSHVNKFHDQNPDRDDDDYYDDDDDDNDDENDHDDHNGDRVDIHETEHQKFGEHSSKSPSMNPKKGLSKSFIDTTTDPRSLSDNFDVVQSFGTAKTSTNNFVCNNKLPITSSISMDHIEPMINQTIIGHELHDAGHFEKSFVSSTLSEPSNFTNFSEPSNFARPSSNSEKSSKRTTNRSQVDPVSKVPNSIVFDFKKIIPRTEVKNMRNPLVLNDRYDDNRDQIDDVHGENYHCL